MNFLGKNIRYLRDQIDKTQTDIASVIKKGQTTIGNWENGRSEPGIEELLILSNYFDISVDILLKIDLSLTNWQSRPREDLLPHSSIPIPYDHAGQLESIVQDPEDKSLTYVLKEIKAIRAEIEQIHSRLPDDPAV